MTSVSGSVSVIVVLTLASIGLAGPYSTPTRQDVTREYVFVEAAKRGDENAVRKALDEDSTLAQAVDDQNMTALDWAATREHWHIFQQLLAKGAPVSRVGSDGGTVLHRVAHHDRSDMLLLLIEAGGDITTQNQWGRAPLHVAARRGNPQVASLLIDHGADLNATTNEGWTPLHVAYRAGQPELVEVLQAAGADGSLRDDDGLVPAEHAFERPAEHAIEEAALYEYQGLYDVGEYSHFKVWVEDGSLRLREYADDELYATGPDTFYCISEPWSVSFQRDAAGNVQGIEVQFLRRAVQGVKRDHPLYVGSDVCGRCHFRESLGNQYVPWVSSRHGAAYWRLASRWSAVLARSRPHFQGLENPREDDRCLLCHITGAQDPEALFASSFDKTEGIGCESCHGPGSLYIAPSVMANHEAFLEAGGKTPGETTCRGCHRVAERFEFNEWWPVIAHGGPGNQ